MPLTPKACIPQVTSSSTAIKPVSPVASPSINKYMTKTNWHFVEARHRSSAAIISLKLTTAFPCLSTFAPLSCPKRCRYSTNNQIEQQTSIINTYLESTDIATPPSILGWVPSLLYLVCDAVIMQYSQQVSFQIFISSLADEEDNFDVWIGRSGPLVPLW